MSEGHWRAALVSHSYTTRPDVWSFKNGRECSQVHSCHTRDSQADEAVFEGHFGRGIEV